MHCRELPLSFFKSLRKKGFGLTVAEGMWKGKPLYGGAVGGITAQIIYGETGFIVSSMRGRVLIELDTY